ncbi:hypothetical protein HYU21_04845 [Candidatus Woesearchaeota archaeon]|nr:hypothetical protein [Candidatus Woesearchaeota archaeon]
MRPEKHQECLNEVLDEIATALKDPRGLIAHQRRLAFLLSLGTATIIELYLHRLNVIKEGAKINHEWFKRKKDKVLQQLQNQVVSPLNNFPELDELLEIALKIETKRDDLAYGAPASESIIQEKINLFFKLKELAKC